MPSSQTRGTQLVTASLSAPGAAFCWAGNPLPQPPAAPTAARRGSGRGIFSARPALASRMELRGTDIKRSVAFALKGSLFFSCHSVIAKRFCEEVKITSCRRQTEVGIRSLRTLCPVLAAASQEPACVLQSPCAQKHTRGSKVPRRSTLVTRIWGEMVALKSKAAGQKVATCPLPSGPGTKLALRRALPWLGSSDPAQTQCGSSSAAVSPSPRSIKPKFGVQSPGALEDTALNVGQRCALAAQQAGAVC